MGKSKVTLVSIRLKSTRIDSEGAKETTIGGISQRGVQSLLGHFSDREIMRQPGDPGCLV